MKPFFAFILTVLPSTIGLIAQDSTFSTCQHLDVNEFYLKLNSSTDPTLIDARTADEYFRERIPGAVLAENREVLLKITDSLDFDTRVFLYCEHDERSYVACRILTGGGFRHVYILKGGLMEWRLESYELDRKKIRKKRTLF